MDKKEIALNMLSQEQPKKVFIVNILLAGEIYYLSDLNFSISRNVRDSFIILSENNAAKLATVLENQYPESTGRVSMVSINQILY